tara:strand:+ start:2964 stop:3782 length:819 start_codon:yes stop_codon:yes gene_type:complete
MEQLTLKLDKYYVAQLAELEEISESEIEVEDIRCYEITENTPCHYEKYMSNISLDFDIDETIDYMTFYKRLFKLDKPTNDDIDFIWRFHDHGIINISPSLLITNDVFKTILLLLGLKEYAETRWIGLYWKYNKIKWTGPGLKVDVYIYPGCGPECEIKENGDMIIYKDEISEIITDIDKANIFKKETGNNIVITMKIRQVYFDTVYDQIFGHLDTSHLSNPYSHKLAFRKKFVNSLEMTTFQDPSSKRAGTPKIDYQLVMFNYAFRNFMDSV